MTRLAMIVDIINQDLIIPNVEKVAKLCADFKTGVETIFVNHENKQEYIEVDDEVRQGDYKYTYSDSSATAEKSQQADLMVTAVEKFAQLIPLNLQEIFIWYFEQKGVDNPERFLGESEDTGVNIGVNSGVNSGGDEGQPVSANQAGSVENLDALNPTQPQAEDMNTAQEPSAEELPQEQSAEPQGQGLNAEALMKLIPVISKLKQSGKGSFSKILSSVLNQ